MNKVITFVAPLLFASLILSTSSHAAENQQQQFINKVLSIAEKKPKTAVRILQKQLQKYPTWHRGRLELARLYYRAGDYQRAKRAVKRVVKQAKLPKSVKKNIVSFYRQILAAESKRKKRLNSTRIRAKISTSLGHDTNPGSGPANQDIGVDNVRLKASALARSDNFWSTQVQLYLDTPLSEVSQQGRQPGLWRWTNQLSLFDRAYHREKDSDIRNLQWITGLNYQINERWQAATKLKFNHLRYGSEKKINYAGIEPSISWSQGKHRWQLTALYNDRNYVAQSSAGKDGAVTEAGFSYAYRPSKRWLLQLASKRTFADYLDNRSSYQATDSWTRASYRSSKKLKLWTLLRYRTSKYEAPETPLYSDAREEDYFTLRIGSRYQLSDDLNMELVLSHYRNSANHKLHEYDRQQAELKLNWLF